MARGKKIEESGLYNPYELSWGEKIEFPSTRNLHEYGNRIYNRYPARSVFLVPRAILSQFKDKSIKVLDPFMGSGTTAVETILSGNIPYGLEMDPFARMVAEASSSVFNKSELEEIIALKQEIIDNWRKYKPEEKPHLLGVERWFKEGDLESLLRMKKTIISIVPEKYQKFFLVTYADAIKPVSLMERQSLKPYISTKYTKVTKSVDESFEYSFNVHFDAIKEMSEHVKIGGAIRWIGTDATDFSSDENAIDLAITSPPYINALDYTRCIKVESALCGTIDNTIANELRQKQVGHERRRNQDIYPVVSTLFQPLFDEIAKKDSQRAHTSLSYFNDIYKNLICVCKVLRPKGEYHIIIGDNTIRDIDIPTHEIISSLAQKAGYEHFGYYKYNIRDHRTSIPRNKAKSKIQIEHVLMLRKV